MTKYLGHQFEGGRCILCGATEKIIREFETSCAKADMTPSGLSPTMPDEKPKSEDPSPTSPPVLVKKIDAPPQAAFSTVPTTDFSRYRDAYSVATAMEGIAAVIKVIGLGVGGLILILALIVGGQMGSAGLSFAAGLLAGLAVAIPTFVMGILLSAQAQILKATLDTAVHTSPFLSKEDMAHVMSPRAM